MKTTWLFLVALCIVASHVVQCRDTSATTEMSHLRFFLGNVFRAKTKPVKAGIVEPSAIGDSPESDSRSSSLDIGDFLSDTGSRSASAKRDSNSNGVLRNLFRSLTEDDLNMGIDEDLDLDDDSEPEATTTTRRPSLIIRGARRIMGALRSTTARGWRNFIRSLLPAFFP